jgi:putative alpha-1,2-mannosidase
VGLSKKTVVDSHLIPEKSTIIYEGNAWQYTFLYHKILGMIEAYGGKDKFEAKLDQMFNKVKVKQRVEQVDVTGLIGQYARKRTSHHMAYLYNYIENQKTREKYIIF